MPDPNSQYLDALSSENPALEEYNRIFLGSIPHDEDSHTSHTENMNTIHKITQREEDDSD